MTKFLEKCNQLFDTTRVHIDFKLKLVAFGAYVVTSSQLLCHTATVLII